jgi:isoleucyl-tRNA synthetase
MRFSWEETEAMQRRLNILWNVFRFPLPYMRMDGFSPDGVSLADVRDDLETVDEWVLSRLQSVEAEMADHWAEFRQDRALDALLSFVVDDVSRFYVQAVRERMWKEEDDPSKTAAYATLYHVLREVTALLAPYAPLVAEEVYGNLTGEAGHPTVHMCDWPEADAGWRDDRLEEDVRRLREVEEAGAEARQQAERSLRWPVTRVVVVADDERTVDAVDRHRPLLRERLNAETIELVEPGEDWGEVTYSARADMSVLGPAFGGDAADVMNALNEAEVDEQSLGALERAVADATGMTVDLTDEMVEFETNTPPEVSGVEFGGGVVYVDTALTEAIEREGYAREVVRRLQEMRKALDLDIETEVRVAIAVDDDRVATLVRDREGYIAEEVRVAGFVDDDELDTPHRERFEDVEGVALELAIEPVAAPPASD